MKSSRNKKKIMMPRIGPGLMMSRINEKATYGRLSSRKGGGLLYLILKRFACVNKYIIETQ